MGWGDTAVYATIWAGLENSPRLEVDAFFATFLLLCIALAESSEYAFCRNLLNRGNVYFSPTT